jgi:phytoene synthase
MPLTGSAVDADIAACLARLRQGSKSFHLAARLLPRRVREPASALYAFCRLADDRIDLEGGRADALDELSTILDRVYGRKPGDDPMERALADVVARHGLPRDLLDALIEGLSWDAEGRRVDDLAGLRAYAARVAGTVGVMTTLLMGVRSSEALSRAADLGVAMQFTNIARDVGEDARAGRLYLPEAWMRDAGIEPDAWLKAPSADRRVFLVVQRLLRAADRLYLRSAAGIALLPKDCRPGIHAARLIYAEIGQEVLRLGVDGLDQRAVVPGGRKLRRVGEAFGAALAGRAGAGASPLDETRFLVEAVEQASPASPCDADPARIPWWDLDRRIGQTIELFTRLEQQDRLARQMLLERMSDRR